MNTIKIDYPWGTTVTKHLAGKHDQSSHGGGGKMKGGKGGNAASLANSVLAKAKQKEPMATKTLQSLAGKTGGKLEGLEYRLKSPESLTRKIKADAKDMGISENESAGMVTDALRYTMTFDKKNMVKNVNGTFSELEKQGWSKYDDKVKNYYRPGDAYDGLNTVVQHEDGTRMELQFHTPESLAIKHKAHKLYEKARVLPKDDPERVRLNDQMVAMWNDYDRPENWESLPGRIV